MEKKYFLEVKDRGNYVLEFDYDGSYNTLNVHGYGWESLIHCLRGALGYSENYELKDDLVSFGIESAAVAHGMIRATGVLRSDLKKTTERIIEWFKSKDEFKIGNPTAISVKFAKMLNEKNYYCFSMKLEDFLGKDSGNGPSKYQVNMKIGGVRTTMSNNEEYALIPVESKKYNFIDIEDDRKTITFTGDKDYYNPKVNAKRQNGKLSKIISDIVAFREVSAKEPSEADVDDDPHDTLRYAFHIDDPAGSYLFYGHDKYLEDTAQAYTINKKALENNLEKMTGRGIELYLTDLQPRKFDIKVTENVGLVYGIKNSLSKAGTLGNSCMAPHNRSSYNCANQADFYNNIPDVSIVYSVNEQGGLLGRALIWKDATSPQHDGPFTFIDRIYGAEDFVSIIKKWGYEKGYFSKVEQSCGNTTIENKDGLKLTEYKTKTIRMPKGKISRMIPYFDTMKWFDVTSKSKRYATLSLSTHNLGSSVQMSGCDARPVIIPCEHCGTLVAKNGINSAYYADEYGNDKYLQGCGGCSVTYNGSRYIKTDKDVKMTFNSRGPKLMPLKVQQAGKLVKVNIDGREVVFDATDKYGIENFFSKKVVKVKPKKKRVKKVVSVEKNGPPWEPTEEVRSYVGRSIMEEHEAMPQATTEVEDDNVIGW